PLALTVAQIDHMSAGRIELGLGAGWYEDEHRSLGIPFPPMKERFERLEEQLEIVTGVWSASAEHPFSFEGRHYRLSGNIGLPRPIQRPYPPVIVGGVGTTVTPRLAARFADELNIPFPPFDLFAARQESADQACQSIGRDPASLRRSVALVTCCGEDEKTFVRRAEAIGREPAELRSNGAAGTPKEVAATLRHYAEAGAEIVYLQILDLSDLDHLEVLASEVIPDLT
ncbi:MAG: LLM class flavin-dependent oxidoreductase, partial [Acidimicrobiales bacterium]